MPQQELLKHAIAALDAAGIAHMMTGSYVSSMQGEPRATHDIDIVVELSYADAQRLLAGFPAPRFYFGEAAVREAISRGGMFNIVDTQSGDKLDLWLLTDDPFDLSRFSRRESVNFHGLRLTISRPEDTILQKLKWAQLSGGSEKQRTDALHVLELQFAVLDWAYLSRWSAHLGVTAALEQLRQDAEPLE